MTENSAKFAKLSKSTIHHAVSTLRFHFISIKVRLSSCVEILPRIVKYCQLLLSIVKFCWGVILSIAMYCQLVLWVNSQYCQLVFGGYSQYCQVLSSCVGVLPSIVSTRSCRQNTEERSAETRQTQTMTKAETKIKTNTKTMTRTKIKTETKTDTGRSTGTRGGRSLSAGQGLCELVRNHVCGHKIVQDWYIIV